MRTLVSITRNQSGKGYRKMRVSVILRRGLLAAVTATVFIAPAARDAAAQDKEPIRIGFIHDYTGPFAGGGSEPAAVGTKLMVDRINAAACVKGHKIEAIYADAHSKVDVAINDAESLIGHEKADRTLGISSHPTVVPLPPK